jgi:hypothetical protein
MADTTHGNQPGAFMIRIPLPGKDAAILLLPRWGEFGTAGQAAMLLVLVLAPVILALWLYRYELRLVRGRTATILLTLRLVLLFLLSAIIAFQPVVAHFSTGTDKGLILVAVDRSASMEVADPQPNDKEKTESRSETARKILAPDGLDLLTALAKNHEVRLVGFHQTIWDAKDLSDLFAPPNPAVPFPTTNLDLPLTRALETPGRLKAALLLTDGQHNSGPDPLLKARELAHAKVPIFPLPVGSPAPPDIALFEVKGPTNVFQEADASLTARFKIRGIPAQEVHVELWNKKAGRLEEQKTIWHDGRDRVHSVRFEMFLKQPGTHNYEVKVRPGDPATREITEVNNSMPAVIRVSKDKVKVLIIDGEARWEHHYLASALSRDHSIALDRVLFNQPRLGRIPEKELEKSGNPKLKLPAPEQDGDPLFTYDCIFLGDVSPKDLPLGDRQRLRRYVSDMGGTLIIQAGKRFMPLDYFDMPQAGNDPLVQLLPIASPEIIKSTSGFPLLLTREGNATTFLQLDSGPEQNRQRWAEFPNHYWAVVGKPRPGATILAYGDDPDSPSVKPEKTKGILVQHHVGLGQVLYVGVESTWRWRFKIGDQYHHRFWGQVVRWAAADKLLPAGTPDVRYGSREPIYSQGKAVDIGVRLGGKLKLPGKDQASAQIIRVDPGNKESVAALVPLLPAPLQPRLLTGQVHDLPAGAYRINLDIPILQKQLPAPEKAGGDTFTVLAPTSGEMIDLAANRDLLENLATQTNGEVLTPETIHKLADLLEKDQVQPESRQDAKPWQDPPLVWFTLGIFLTLLTAEWTVRKLAGLP